MRIYLISWNLSTSPFILSFTHSPIHPFIFLPIYIQQGPKNLQWLKTSWTQSTSTGQEHTCLAICLKVSFSLSLSVSIHPPSPNLTLFPSRSLPVSFRLTHFSWDTSDPDSSCLPDLPQPSWCHLYIYSSLSLKCLWLRHSKQLI